MNFFNSKFLPEKTIFESKSRLMKTTFSILFLGLLLMIAPLRAQSNPAYVQKIKHFQENLNSVYSNPKKSPLKQEDLAAFKTLDFFKIDEHFKVTATLEKTPNDPIFEMQTTTDRKPLYKRYGIATFEFNGKKHQLNIYQNQQLMMDFEYRNHLFLLFTDTTNGQETYKAGRYIDLEIPSSTNTIEIDFNKAYNPYCAYNSKYSCPVVPKENHLNLAIKAGVKAFNKY